jgi:hypothetical protein
VGRTHAPRGVIGGRFDSQTVKERCDLFLVFLPRIRHTVQLDRLRQQAELMLSRRTISERRQPRENDGERVGDGLAQPSRCRDVAATPATLMGRDWRKREVALAQGSFPARGTCY